MNFLFILDNHLLNFVSAEIRGILDSVGIDNLLDTRYTPNNRLFLEADPISGFYILSRAATIREAYILVWDTDSLDWRWIFRTVVSSSGYFVPYTFRLNYFDRVPSSLRERIVKSIIEQFPLAKVSLRFPQIILSPIDIEESTIMGIKLATARDKILIRDPRYRPFAPPTAMESLLTRVLLNMLGLKPKKVFLDPFCGTGSLAIDASLLGYESICVDINSKVLEATKMLSEYYNANIKIVYGDARNLPFEDNTIDGIATDPPYGIGSPTFGIKVEDLYYDFLVEAYRILKSRSKVVICYTPKINLKRISNKIGFELLYTTSMRVHSGLTRFVSILRLP